MHTYPEKVAHASRTSMRVIRMTRTSLLFLFNDLPCQVTRQPTDVRRVDNWRNVHQQISSNYTCPMADNGKNARSVELKQIWNDVPTAQIFSQCLRLYTNQRDISQYSD